MQDLNKTVKSEWKMTKKKRQAWLSRATLEISSRIPMNFPYEICVLVFVPPQCLSSSLSTISGC